MSLSASQGVEVTGQHDAIVRIADRIVKAQCSDEWGVGFPVAAPILTACKESTRADVQDTRANTSAAAPARAAWCYGPPGVARALWLAGVASDRSEYRDLALAAMTAVFERPIPNRRIDSPTLCHGVAGLLQITLRFARDGAGEIFSTAAQELTAQLLDAHEPDSRFGYRDLKPSGQRTDNPGLLEGAAGVALVLLAAATSRGADLGPDPDAVMTLYDPLDFAVVRAPLTARRHPRCTSPTATTTFADVLSSEARAALAVASLTFSDALAKDGAGPLRPRTESTLRRYLIRMSTRPTPLGLFAAVGLADWGERTDIELTAGHRPRRTRPDAAWLLALVDRAESDPQIRRHLHVRANPSGAHACRADLSSPSGYLATVARRYRCRFEPPRSSSVP